MAIKLGYQHQPNEMSLAKFTNELLQEKIFECSVCKNLLQIPVVYVKCIGNICKSCRDAELKDFEGFENTVLTTILKKLKLPCKYHVDGCNRQIMYADLEAHHAKCDYRYIECLSAEKGCKWKGTLVNLLHHFKTNHTDEIIHFSNEPFYLTVPIADITAPDLIITKLLTSKKVSYFVRMIGSGGDNLIFVIYALHGLESSTHQRDEIAVRYIGEFGKYEITCPVSSLRTIDSEMNIVKISTEIIREIAGQNPGIVIEISRNVKRLPEEIFECLECPICYKWMNAAIFLCNNGHSVCDLCRPKITQCPLCRAQTSTNMRNYTMEKLMSKIRTIK